jgi:hypothetical protein
MMPLTATCFFYAPFLFDTLGDSVSAAKAAWVVVLLVVLPLASYAAVLLRGAGGLGSVLTGRKNRNGSAATAAASVELSEVAQQAQAGTGRHPIS